VQGLFFSLIRASEPIDRGEMLALCGQGFPTEIHDYHRITRGVVSDEILIDSDWIVETTADPAVD
jgi:hypothetical protein